MFDPDQFIATTRAVQDIFFKVARQANLAFDEVLMLVSLSRDDLDPHFLEHIREAWADAQISAHARLSFEETLQGDLPDALRLLRRAHNAASGGLADSTWQKAELIFILSEGGAFSLVYNPDDFAPDSDTGFGISLDPHHPVEDLAARLARHARLDLTGPTRRYMLSNDKAFASAPAVDAPDGVRAMARLVALTNTRAEEWTHLQEVLDARSAQAEAIALLDTP